MVNKANNQAVSHFNYVPISEIEHRMLAGWLLNVFCVKCGASATYIAYSLANKCGYNTKQHRQRGEESWGGNNDSGMFLWNLSVVIKLK